MFVAERAKFSGARLPINCSLLLFGGAACITHPFFVYADGCLWSRRTVFELNGRVGSLIGNDALLAEAHFGGKSVHTSSHELYRAYKITNKLQARLSALLRMELCAEDIALSYCRAVVEAAVGSPRNTFRNVGRLQHI